MKRKLVKLRFSEEDRVRLGYSNDTIVWDMSEILPQGAEMYYDDQIIERVESDIRLPKDTLKKYLVLRHREGNVVVHP